MVDFSALLRRAAAYAARRVGRPPPVNYLRRDPALIDEDVKYAIANSRSNLEYVSERCGTSISKSVVLEIGPGTNFAPQLVIAGKGAKVLIADRFLAPWNPIYHPEFYRRFLEAWQEPCPALLKVIERHCYPADVITLIEEPIEALNSIPDQSVDVVISNAVMEHVVDLDAAIRELARIARPNGVQSHQVDFRDHKDFDRPLDFLAIERSKIRKIFAATSGERGNRRRPSEMAALLESNGFVIDQMAIGEPVNPKYLVAFIPKLRASKSRYKEVSEDDLTETQCAIFCSTEDVFRDC